MPTPAHARCERGVARAAGGFARRYGRCFVRLHADGGDGAGTGDARTLACTASAAARAAAAIDDACGSGAPACHGGLSGAAWVDLVRAAVDHGWPVIFCREPWAVRARH